MSSQQDRNLNTGVNSRQNDQPISTQAKSDSRPSSADNNQKNFQAGTDQKSGAFKQGVNDRQDLNSKQKSGSCDSGTCASGKCGTDNKL